MLLNIEHNSFSHIANTRFIDKTINVTIVYDGHTTTTLVPPSPSLSQGGRGGTPHARRCARALITLNVSQSVLQLFMYIR